jgi:NAD(P)-dependent dehydrogenase (short-subunit alcohol dehydrogenase family)
MRLDAAGWRVFAGVRREADAGLLREAGSERLAPLILDVTDAGQIEAAAEEIAARTGSDGLDGLVNNAGISLPSPLETIPIEDFRKAGRGQPDRPGRRHPGDAARDPRGPRPDRLRQLDRRADRLPDDRRLPRREVRGRGGRRRLPARAAQAGGSQSRSSSRGSIATEIWDRGEAAADEIAGRSPQRDALYGKAIERYRKTFESVAGRGIPPDRAARTIERALTATRPRARYLIGTDAKLQARVRHLIPTFLFDRILGRATGV